MVEKLMELTLKRVKTDFDLNNLVTGVVHGKMMLLGTGSPYL